MYRNGFIKELNRRGYSFKIEGDRIIVDHKSYVLLSVTGIPKGVVFSNKGLVSMIRLTYLPGDTIFQNDGWVNMYSLTKLPEWLKFYNSGNIYLHSLTGRHRYLGKDRLFENVDGVTVLVNHHKTSNGCTIKIAQYFEGGSIDRLKKCYIAESNGIAAHGGTVTEAIDNLPQETINRTAIEELAEEIEKYERERLSLLKRATVMVSKIRHAISNLFS